MKKKYTKKQIQESINHWKKVLESMDNAFSYDAEVDGEIATVGDLMKILTEYFNPTDKLNICDQDGDPDHRIISIWNAGFENDMTGGQPSSEDICYIRIGS